MFILNEVLFGTFQLSLILVNQPAHFNCRYAYTTAFQILASTWRHVLELRLYVALA